MKILVTGSEGFIGKNLIAHLSEDKDIDIVKFDHNKNFDFLEKNIDDVNYIFHLAGVNRPNDNNEFYEGNTGLTKQLVELLEKKSLSVPIVYTSSVQAELDNDYGKSKKQAEDAILKYGNGSLAYRLHNVFGKWSRPNYNSVIATFCNNIANGTGIIIDDRDKELELIYIDDIIYEFKEIIKGKEPTERRGDYCYINPRYKASLGYIADLIYSFKDSVGSITVPATGNDFTKKLHSTYITYLPLNELVTTTEKNEDERGSFIELVRTNEAGQMSISFSKPGVVRGNHYHHTKIERFIVVKGSAKINLVSILDDNDTYEFDVDDSGIQIVTVPPGYTHSIVNTGDSEMVLALWANELFDKDFPDTYFREIVKGKNKADGSKK